MQPFTVILGVVFGSLFSIEMPELFRATLIFGSLALIAGFGFLGTIRHRTWRYAPLAILWVGLGLAGWYYWPS